MRSTALLILVLLGCAVDPTLAPRDCTPGQTAPCACPGATGVQTCEAPGELGACVCPDAGSAADVPATDAPAQPVDAPPVPDAAPDAPTDAADAGSPQDAPQDAPAPDVVMSPADVPRTCPDVDLMRDVANCGACGNACPMFPNDMMRCVEGSCVSFGCVVGFLGCDSNTANGCETEILANVRHCGACRRACAPSQTCRNGVCR